MTIPDHLTPGASVILNGIVRGQVECVQVCRNGSGELYVSQIHVIWWDGYTRNLEWVEAWEVSPADAPAPVMGFPV